MHLLHPRHSDFDVHTVVVCAELLTRRHCTATHASTHASKHPVFPTWNAYIHRAQGHPDLTTSPGRPQIAEGDRLDLSPNVDAIRARAPAALVLPEHVPRLRHSGEVPDDLYRDADYGYDLNKVRVRV